MAAQQLPQTATASAAYLTATSSHQSCHPAGEDAMAALPAILVSNQQ